VGGTVLLSGILPTDSYLVPKPSRFPISLNVPATDPIKETPYLSETK